MALNTVDRGFDASDHGRMAWVEKTIASRRRKVFKWWWKARKLRLQLLFQHFQGSLKILRRHALLFGHAAQFVAGFIRTQTSLSPPPHGGPGGALDDMARYVHRTAIGKPNRASG
jgi:hypothetical protein